jgi:putative ABC transport system permease protein
MVRNTLVVAEVAVSLVLLAGAALFGRSLVTLMAVDSGIEAEQVMVGRVNLAGATYAGPEPKVAFFETLMEGLQAQPGVVAAGGVTFLPMDGLGAATSFWPADRPAPAADDRVAADIRNVVGDYFGAMGIQLLQGRLFDERDRADGPQTVVVNRTLAETYWPNGSALGKQVVVSWDDLESWEIVGVVEDVRSAGLDTEAREAIYMHYPRATFFPWMHVTVRAAGDPTALTATVRRQLQAMDPTLPLGSVRVMQDIVDTSAARPRMTAYLMLVFSVLATILAGVGLYGVLAYAVSQRVREIGVRVALGAEPRDVIRMVVRQGSGLAVVGLVIGFGIALAGGRVLTSLLYEVQPTDPWALGGAGLFLLAIALAATLVPAWRAARVPPAEALRSD